MLIKKNYTIVGLTTYNNEFLRVSIPGLARLKQKIYLIIHNDNPKTIITKGQIRCMGYNGPVYIINSAQNVGTMESRINILDAISQLKINSQWMVFCDDDDILTNLDIPVVHHDNYAILQNTIVIKKRLVDLFQAIDNPANIKIDNNNILIERPHIGTVGTLLKTDLMVKLGEILRPIINQIRAIDHSLGYRAPDDLVLWTYIQIYAKALNPNASAIYMDHINYIATKLDSANIKYGERILPSSDTERYYDGAIRRYTELFNNTLDIKSDRAAQTKQGYINE